MINNKASLAKSLFTKGYNCAQSVVGAFAEEIGVDRETAIRMSSSFGGGMGRLREVCGAVSGMFMVLGILYGYSDPCATEEKKELYKKVQLLAEEFSQKNKSIICRDLLGIQEKKDNPTPDARSDNYYKARPCVELVGDAAQILEDFINQN